MRSPKGQSDILKIGDEYYARISQPVIAIVDLGPVQAGDVLLVENGRCFGVRSAVKEPEEALGPVVVRSAPPPSAKRGRPSSQDDEHDIAAKEQMYALVRDHGGAGVTSPEIRAAMDISTSHFFRLAGDLSAEGKLRYVSELNSKRRGQRYRWFAVDPGHEAAPAHDEEPIPEPESAENAPQPEVSRYSDRSREAILGFVREHPDATIDAIKVVLGGNESLARYYVKVLRAERLLIQNMKDNVLRYRANDELPHSATPSAQYSETPGA